MMEERLQKYLARCGVASRRKCEELILDGRVAVDDAIANELGVKVEPEKQEVKVDGKVVAPEERKVYIALNKPTGYVTTVKDEKGRKTVVDLIDVHERIYPIGRLDYDTSGLLLLTNDGELYNKIIHPRSEKNKTYVAEVKGHPTDSELERFRNGLDIGDHVTSKARIRIVRKHKETCVVEIIIHEGKNRQVRRMCQAISHPVITLERVQVAGISLGNLKPGQWRHLEEEEIESLMK